MLHPQPLSPSSGNSIATAPTSGDAQRRHLAMNSVNRSDDDIDPRTSDDVIHRESLHGDDSSGRGLGGGVGGECGLLQRRESFLYRSNSDYMSSSIPPTKSFSHQSSFNDRLDLELRTMANYIGTGLFYRYSYLYLIVFGNSRLKLKSLGLRPGLSPELFPRL